MKSSVVTSYDRVGGDSKKNAKIKFHYENEATSMMAGLEIARLTIGIMDINENQETWNELRDCCISWGIDAMQT